MGNMTEKFILEKLNQKFPMEVNILNSKFILRNSSVYSPGKLTEFFAQYILDNFNLASKKILDLGCGCFALGIILAKAGAAKVIGIDIESHAIACAAENIRLNHVTHNACVLQGDGIAGILDDYRGNIDIIIGGLPWETISEEAFNKIDDAYKPLFRSFYDMEDRLIQGLLKDGPSLLAPDGRVFVTSSSRTFERLQIICRKFQWGCTIVHEKQLHDDGDKEYIVELNVES
jgi:release factor glutamine methyltransferase